VTRKFKTEKAKRERVPMLVALTGASGSGKTYSALRLATGMAKVTGGRVIVIDTEARRSLHYADDFDFDFVEMQEPFGPLDYLEAIKHATSGSKDDIVIVDSMSHEHEGPGGVLEMHDEETERLMKAWNTTRDKAQMSGWGKPKAQRKRLIQTILRMGVNGIFCFRAKEKMDLSGSKPQKKGWMAVGGEEFIYEMLIHILLYPRGGGVPVWKPKERAEDDAVKVPDKLRGLFPDNQPLDEACGEALAHWAKGDDVPALSLTEAIESMEKAPTQAALTKLMKQLAAENWSVDDKKSLRSAAQARKAALKAGTSEPSVPQDKAARTGDPAEPASDSRPEGEVGPQPPAGPSSSGQGRGESTASRPTTHDINDADAEPPDDVELPS
jgi:hypothetical protein